MTDEVARSTTPRMALRANTVCTCRSKWFEKTQFAEVCAKT